MKYWILAIFLAIVAIAPIGYLTYDKIDVFSDSNVVGNDSEHDYTIEFEPQRVTSMDPGSEHIVLACRVVDGYKFDMYLLNEEHIEAHLTVATKSGSKQFVENLLKKTTSPPPVVTLLRDTGDHWIVDFEFMVEGEKTNLLTLLKKQGLTF